MNINQATVDLVKEFEGFRAEAYLCPAGILTIGYGITANAGIGVNPVRGMTVTRAEAERHLRMALDKFAADIRPAIKMDLNDNEFGACLSLAYNIGAGAFRKSTLLRKLNAGDKAGAAAEFARWNKAGGKVLAGLVRRREAERALFLTRPSARVNEAEKTEHVTPWAALLRLILSLFRKVKA